MVDIQVSPEDGDEIFYKIGLAVLDIFRQIKGVVLLSNIDRTAIVSLGATAYRAQVQAQAEMMKDKYRELDNKLLISSLQNDPVGQGYIQDVTTQYYYHN